jgi:hypothetical protein
MRKLKIATSIMLIFTLLCGCGAKTKDMTPEQILDAFVEDFRACDFEGMYSLTNDEYAYFEGIYDEKNENANNRYLFNTMTDNLKVEVTKVDMVDDETANIYTNVSNINMYNVINDITKSQDEENVVQNTVEAHKDDIVEKEVVFNFVKKDGNWVIESNLGIYSDLSGGYLQYVYEVSWLGMTGDEARERYNNQ